MLGIAGFVLGVMVLLHLGYALSARLPVALRMALPAAVLAGLAGLGGRLVLERHALFKAMLAPLLDFGLLLPGMLLLPVMVASSVGERAGGAMQRSSNIGAMAAAGIVLFGLQVALGGFLGAEIARAMPDLELYNTFGLELVAGFVGGHATAGVIGSILHKLGNPDWALAQALAVTYASIGLVLGVATGLAAVELRRRRTGGAEARRAAGPTAEAPPAEPAARRRQRFGVTLLVVLAGVALTLGMYRLARWAGVPMIENVPVWVLGLLLARLLWIALRNSPAGRQVDVASRDRIAGYSSDLAVVAALLSLPVEMIGAYALPVVVISCVGLVATAIVVAAFSALAFSNARFERAMLIYGTATGGYLTGLLLLRAADPDGRTSTLRDGSLAYPLMAVVSLMALPAIAVPGMAYGPVVMASTGIGICLLGVLAMAIRRLSVTQSLML